MWVSFNERKPEKDGQYFVRMKVQGVGDWTVVCHRVRVDPSAPIPDFWIEWYDIVTEVMKEGLKNYLKTNADRRLESMRETLLPRDSIQQGPFVTRKLGYFILSYQTLALCIHYGRLDCPDLPEDAKPILIENDTQRLELKLLIESEHFHQLQDRCEIPILGEFVAHLPNDETED